jgi:predicted O-linked N-acetylglucosamine transferase (SPINDLY family)
MPEGVITRFESADPSPAELLNYAIDLDRAGDTGRAHTLMRRLADRLPAWDEPLARLANSQRAHGSVTAAADTYRAALALNPNRVPALLALGALLIEAGAAREATVPLVHCCDLAPGNPDAWSTLARAYLDIQEPALALAAFTRAQRLAPGSIALVHQLVSAAMAAGRGPAEATRLEEASQGDPLDPIPHLIRGLILDRLGLLDPAIDALEAAVALAPGAREPIRVLAGVLSRTARSRDAEAALRQALELDPTNPQLMNDHAAILMRVHRHAEARDLLREVLWRNGLHASVLCNLANATLCLGLQSEALELAQAAIALDAGAVLPRRSLINTLPYQDGITGTALLRAARDCAERLPRGSLPGLRKVTGPDRLLTVGLLSGSLRTHPVGWLTIAGFEHLDPSAFQIVCLSRALEPGDPIAARFHTVAQSWENISPLDDDALARRARELGIDILIDLGGHGDGSRMAACARRLAPVQIKWVGMQNHSTGMPEMDWLVTDRWETPPALEPLYSERLLRLPDGYVCYAPPAHAPDVVAAPVLRNGFVTFGCFNNIAKITTRAIAAWCEILRELPGSRLVLKTHQLGDAPTAARFRESFRAFGVDPKRVQTRGSSPHRVFLANYNDIDIVLDPFPYSGGLTTCEALWMGVPTVTLPGEIFASRHSVSHLSNAGYPGWVAHGPANYRDIALTWARDPDRLGALRETMRSQVRASPLCDAPRFGRALGMALRHAWTGG